VDVEVADQGPGIPDCELEALRSGDERALLHGSGIGLWLVNWLVTFLDGTLRFEGNDPCGTVVTMTLPVVDGDGGGIESVRS
jgi:sensor histidine kinase regulating citrate/malate metabolism